VEEYFNKGQLFLGTGDLLAGKAAGKERQRL
jgi:hypothetical protein